MDNLFNLKGEELFSWMIYKGMKYPLNKNRYRIKEGDIIKLGRVWLIIRAINIPIKKEKNKRFEIKDTDCNMVSHHNQGNQSLNINYDFNDDNKLCAKFSDESDESSDSEKKEKNKNRSINLIDDNKSKNNKEKDKEKKDEKNLSSNIQKICRICYMEEDNPLLNPLIKPCKCAGSTKYIHLKCLIFWLKTKVEIDPSDYYDNGKYKLYSSEKVECELCKTVFPDYIKHNNRLYNLMDFEQNFGDEENNNENDNITETEGLINKKENENDNNLNNNNVNNNSRKKKKDEEHIKYKINPKKDIYLVADSFVFEKNSPSYRSIAKFSNNILKIGRGIEMDLVMNDLSISRNHCFLELMDNGEILLKDSNSKFGTLVLIQAKKMEILQNQTLSIQVGRTFLNINYKKNNGLFSCCKAEEIDLIKSYEKINYKAVKAKKFCTVITEADSDEEEICNELQKNEKKSDYENDLKNINNNKSNFIKEERMKTYEEQKESGLIDDTKIEIDEKNNTFENIRKDPEL